MLNIHAIPAFFDNYIWAIQGQNSDNVIIVDPGEASPVLHFLNLNHLNPVAIFITHHHADHIGGAHVLAEQFSIPVYGPQREKISCVTHPISPNRSLALYPDFPVFDVIDSAGHTPGHISFYTNSQLFCGDTLFAGGCGRLLGGTAEQLFTSLQTLKSLPQQTQVYCAHEYTQANLKFALAVEPDNVYLKKRIEAVDTARQNNQATVPSTLVDELASNPFLRTDQPAIKKAVEQKFNRSFQNDLDVFTALRQWKDNF